MFITNGGICKLLDFRAALDHRRITMQGHTVGTPAYMAPEHLVGELELDGRADVYPLGLMLYESITGQHPLVFASDVELPDDFEFARRHLYEPWVPPSALVPDLPKSLEAVIDKALAKDRDERFPSMIALRDALRAVLVELDRPAPLPLVKPAPAALVKTKPMTRQIAQVLPRGDRAHARADGTHDTGDAAPRARRDGAAAAGASIASGAAVRGRAHVPIRRGDD